MKKIRDIMTRDVETVTPGTPIRQVAERMRNDDIGSFPVVDEQGRVIGTITDRDIVCRIVSEGLEPATTMVSEAMTKDVSTCTEDQTIDEAAKLMEERQIRRIPVVDGDGKLVGLITMGKIAKVEDEELSGEVLKEVVQPKR